MEGVTGKYYVSEKGTPVWKTYVQIGEREGKVLLEILMTYVHIPIFDIKLKSTLISSENNWLALNTGKIGHEHKH